MNEPIETYEYNGYTVNIFRDIYAKNPIKDIDLIGEFICFTGSVIDSGNSWSYENLVESVKDRKNLLFGLRLIDERYYSTLYFYHFQKLIDIKNLDENERLYSNYLLIDREKLLKDYGQKRLTKKFREKILKIINEDIELINKWLHGEVYGYKIENFLIPDESSVWGYYDLDDCKNEANNNIDSIIVWEKEEAIKCQQIMAL